MSLIEWNEKLSVKSTEIDNQHKRLIKVINNLHSGIEVGKGENLLSDVLNELIAYTVYHFGTEEKLFNRYAYPEYKQHKNEHDNLTEKAKELKYRFDKGEDGVLTAEVMNFLKEWLNHHILQIDKKFGVFLDNKHMKPYHHRKDVLNSVL